MGKDSRFRDFINSFSSLSERLYFVFCLTCKKNLHKNSIYKKEEKKKWARDQSLVGMLTMVNLEHLNNKHLGHAHLLIMNMLTNSPYHASSLE